MSPGNSTLSLGAVCVGVGIDTARYGHHVSFLDEHKRTAAKAFHFTESAAGYQQLHDALTKLAEKQPGLPFHIRLDAAGQYAENLLQWLHRLPFSTTISVALMESSAKQRTRLINQLQGMLARVFPELAVSVKDLSANWVLSLLEKFPTPDKLARAKPETLAKIPHLASDMAETLRIAAAHSTASNRGPIAEELIRQKVRSLRQEQPAFDDLAALVEQAWQALPDGPAKRIRTIKGIGLQTAAALVAKIVSIERFAKPSALIGDFGVFPEEVDVSGTDRHGNPKRGTEIHMSRKGNDLVRRLLYTAAQCAVSWNPPVKALFARLRATGKEYNVCLGHCMAKLLRQVFALWTKDCDFDPDFESRPKASNEPASNDPASNESASNEPASNDSLAQADQSPTDPVLGESQPPATNAPRRSPNRAQKKGTPQASKGDAPVSKEVTMTSPTHLPPSGPRSVALPQSQPPSARRPITIRATSD